MRNIIPYNFFIFYVLNHKILPCSLHIAFEWLVDAHIQYLKLGCVARGYILVDLSATRFNGIYTIANFVDRPKSRLLAGKLSLLGIPESRASKPAQSNSKRQSGLPKPWLGKIISLKPEICLFRFMASSCLIIHSSMITCNTMNGGTFSPLRVTPKSTVQ